MREPQVQKLIWILTSVLASSVSLVVAGEKIESGEYFITQAYDSLLDEMRQPPAMNGVRPEGSAS